MDDEQRRLEGFLDMFAHPMWPELVKDLEEAMQALHSIESIHDGDELQFRKGQLERMRYFLGLEDTVRRLIAGLKEPDEDVEML